MRESAIARLARRVGGSVQVDENATLERARYVFLHPEIINKRRGNDKPQAKDVHLYRVDDEGNICVSCCGNFDLNRNYDGGKGMMAPTARKHAADKGRDVCGRCVGSLYSNRDSGKQASGSGI